MAFSRNEISRKEQVESLLDMALEPTAGFCSIREARFLEQAKDY
jgi:hypothetical protein